MKPKLIVWGVIAILLLIVTSLFVGFKTIKGSEIGVKETWAGGVIAEPMTPRTYLLFPNFTQRVTPYSISQQVYVMNDDPNDAAEGRERDAYLVQSKDQQNMKISLMVQWRRDPTKIIDLHKSVGMNVEENLLRPELLRIVKDNATAKTALEAYSGAGLVELQTAIQARLRDPQGELYRRGVIVDLFVIQHIGLDPKYVEEITQRQIAIQARLKSIEQTAAALAEAEKAKAEAQANLNRSVVEAERDKQMGILGAEKSAQQQILAAEASKKQTVLAAEAEAEAGKLRGQGILAVGTAEAEANRLKMASYASAGSESFVRIEVAKQLAEGYKGIKGYLPSNMGVNLLTENFNKSVSILAGGEPTK